MKEYNYKDFDYSDVSNSKSFKQSRFAINAVGKLIYNIEYLNEENIPKNQSLIVAANHISRVDGFLIMANKNFNNIHYMAMAKLFRKPLQAKFLRSLNCFPVQSGKGQGMVAVNHAINVLKSGNHIGIMPEGGINRTDDMSPRKAYNGVSIIAKESGADVLPVGIYIDGSLKYGATIKVSFGKVIKNKDLDFTDLNCSTNLIMEKITDEWNYVSNTEFKKQPLNI